MPLTDRIGTHLTEGAALAYIHQGTISLYDVEQIVGKTLYISRAISHRRRQDPEVRLRFSQKTRTTSVVVLRDRGQPQWSGSENTMNGMPIISRDRVVFKEGSSLSTGIVIGFTDQQVIIQSESGETVHRHRNTVGVI